jgi:hypothetical protein
MMNIPDHIQVVLDAIEEKDSFALEAEHQLVEWLEEIESGCIPDKKNSIALSKSGPRTESRSRTFGEFINWAWAESVSFGLPSSKSMGKYSSLSRPKHLSLFRSK